MNGKVIDLLKQDVAKWQEAAKALDELLPNLPEGDRKIWSARSAQYRDNSESSAANWWNGLPKAQAKEFSNCDGRCLVWESAKYM